MADVRREMRDSLRSLTSCIESSQRALAQSIQEAESELQKVLDMTREFNLY